MPVRARSTDPETSHWAAASVNLRDNQREVAVALCGGGPRPHESLVVYLHELGSTQTASGIRTRCHELVELGVVQWAGRWAVTSAGQRTRVWECVHCSERPKTEKVPTSSGRVITRTPRSMPSVKSPASDSPGRQKRTRGASSTGTGHTHEERERAKQRNRERRAAANST